jgi:hypothetical protein
MKTVETILMRKFRLPLFAMLILFAASCEDDAIQSNGKFSASEQRISNASAADHRAWPKRKLYGPSTSIGKGVARAWVMLDIESNPLALGVDISEMAVNSMGEMQREYILSLPKMSNPTQFTTIELDWNPSGHEPEGIYSVPHFDVHFYMISEEDRLSIPAIDPPAMDEAPEEKYLPELYLGIPGVEPEMGAHWVDLLSPEFNGGTFSNSLILGTYDANFIFYEPMITKAYLTTHPNETRPIRQPQAYQRNGYFPLAYSVAYSNNPGQFTISLNDLMYRTGR